MAAKGGVPIWPTTGRGAPVFRWWGGGAVLSVPCEGEGRCVWPTFFACGRGVGQLCSRWPGCPTCWWGGRLIDTQAFGVAHVVGCGRGVVVLWVFLSSALHASVGLCMPLALSNFVDLPTKLIMWFLPPHSLARAAGTVT